MTLNAQHIPLSIVCEIYHGEILRVEARSSLTTVREKKQSWTPDRLCAGIPDAFKIVLSHARQLKFDEEPDYDGPQAAFVDEIEHRGCSPDAPFHWSAAADTEGSYNLTRDTWCLKVLLDFAPSIAKKVPAPQAVTKSTLKLLDSIFPGDFIKFKLLGLPTIQFRRRFNSVDTDSSFWQPPSLAGKQWKSPYRPAIVASVERDNFVHKGRKGTQLTIYPLMLRKEDLDKFPEHMRSRFIPLDASMLGIDSRMPEVEPKWNLANTYIYNTCVTFAVFVDLYLMDVNRSGMGSDYSRDSSPCRKEVS